MSLGILKSIGIPNCGYQVRRKKKDTYISAGNLLLGGIEIGRVLSADEIDGGNKLLLCEGGYVNKYPNGFHVFVNLEDAKRYQHGEDCVIWEVQIIKPICTGSIFIAEIIGEIRDIELSIVVCKYVRILNLDVEEE